MILRAERVISDKRVRIPGRDLRPRYDDLRFLHCIGGMTVFLAEGVKTDDCRGWEEVAGLNYIHSTAAAHSVPFERHRQAWQAAEQAAGNNGSALFFECYLAGILGRDEVEVQHILSGVNITGDGNPYQVFGIVESVQAASRV